MTKYEKQLQQAHDAGVNVYDFFLGNSKNVKSRLDGLYIDGNIALSKNLKTSAERSAVLAEELGHHYTTIGNIIDQANPDNRKQERRARLWAYDKLIGLHGIIEAFEHGCRNRYEIAEYLDVTESFLLDTIAVYREKYGVCKRFQNYVVYFEPTLAIGKLND